MKDSQIANEEGNVSFEEDIPVELPNSTEKPKRGISVGSFRMTNGSSIISSESKKILLNKVISQVDREIVDKGKSPDSCSNQRGSIHNSLSPKRNVGDSMAKLLPPKITKKKTLVLDLDETLVHSSFVPFQQTSDIIIKVEIEGQIYDIHVLVRPGLDDFLNKMAEKYELIIFTASLSKYANPLMNIIDKEGRCLFRLFREHCTLIGTTYVKDLKRLNRDLKEVIILDNSPMSYSLNRDNGFPILSWFDDKTDRELLHVTPILEFLADVPDIREYIPKLISYDEISYQKARTVMINYYSSLQAKSQKSNELVSNQQQQQQQSLPVQEQEKNVSKVSTTLVQNPPKNAIPKNVTSTNKEKPQINIKIINNNITNLIVNQNLSNNRLSTSVNRNRNKLTTEENISSKKFTPKNSCNTFRKNPPRPELSSKVVPTLVKTSETDRKLVGKHKKVESFTFGLNKCTFAGLKSKTINNNRQISVKTGNKIINTNNSPGVIDLAKKNHLNNQLKNLREKTMNQTTNSNSVSKIDTTRPSTSVRLMNKTHTPKCTYINRTSSSRLFYKGGSTPYSFNKNIYTHASTSYNLTEKMHITKPGSSKCNQYKITKKAVKTSQIKDLKLDFTDIMVNKYSKNFSSVSNTHK